MKIFEKELKKFLEKKSKKNKIIVIYWPTASWKTSLSIDIAKKINSEIISTDSRQIFKFLDIWTGKITEKEKQGIEHYMLDIIEPNINYSVWEFKKEAEKILKQIWEKWKIPILCWWTWLYIDSLIYDFKIPRIPADEDLRKDLENKAIKFWNNYLYEKLLKLDYNYAKTLHPNNLQYIIRALEIKILSWKSKSEFIKEKNLKYDTFFITPYLWNREKLYKNINFRVKKMFDDWLVLEVERLLKMWYKKDDFWLKTIWYKETIEFLEWKFSLSETIEKVQKNSRNYAKRQLTWFRKYKNNI
jgi:tRNA dimethylallyltransferase